MFLLEDVEEKCLPGDVAYRYVDIRGHDYHYDWNMEPTSRGAEWSKITLHCFPVKRFTPKGFWIECHDDRGNTEKWIGHDWNRKFACLNQEEAQKSFWQRKVNQRAILEGQLIACERVLKQCEQGNFGDGKVRESLEVKVVPLKPLSLKDLM